MKLVWTEPARDDLREILPILVMKIPVPQEIAEPDQGKSNCTDRKPEYWQNLPCRWHTRICNVRDSLHIAVSYYWVSNTKKWLYTFCSG
jgi:hypothetical protein